MVLSGRNPNSSRPASWAGKLTDAIAAESTFPGREWPLAPVTGVDSSRTGRDVDREIFSQGGGESNQVDRDGSCSPV